MRPLAIDLWYVWSDPLTDPRLLAEYRGLCAPEEVERCGRFALERLRQQFLVTRALVRTVLSHYTPAPPTAWRFSADRYGKPFVTSPAPPPLHFNLSHTEGLVVCGVLAGEHAASCALGVDVEDRDRRTAGIDLARRYFAPAEVAALEPLPPPRRQAAFFDYWTLKEAYVKARGMGLSLPLEQFAFTLAPPAPPRITFTLPGERAEDWSFAQFAFHPRHQGAVAVCGAGGAPLAIRLREVVPLRDPCPTRLAPCPP